MNAKLTLLTLLVSCLAAGPLAAYPLDAYPETGIKRLEAFRVLGRVLPEGAMLPSEGVTLRLENYPNFEIPAADPELSTAIVETLGADAPHYGVVLLDITDPANPRYAAHNPDRTQNVGSVGKIMVDLAWFQALADLYPDAEERKRFLKNTTFRANEFIRNDSHKVPFWEPGDQTVVRRPIEERDGGNLYTWFDWMNSASSNAAASMMMEELILLKHFGKDYPVSEEKANKFFRDTPKEKLSKIFQDAMMKPIRRNGLDPGKLRQGSFFTREGKARVPGTSSYGSPVEMLRYLVLVEQGKLVDPFSSLEIKKMLYGTDFRMRYGASPALEESAVYYKSGSLYSCKPEKGYTCEKYKGNRWNYLSSMTTIESTDRQPALDYIVVVISNVLKKDSAEEHKNLATRIQALMESLHPELLVNPGTDTEDKPLMNDPFSRRGSASPAVAAPAPSRSQR